MQVSPQATYDVPDGLTLGKAFKTLALGQVSSRMSGEAIGAEINRELLEEMVRVYQDRRDADPVIIDWQHATSPFGGGTPAPPESGSALGLIVDLELREDGLYAVPAYNERGLKVVKDAGGVLWSSPEYLQGEIFTRDGGEKVGDAQLLAITLTPRPAQSHHKIDRVTLSEKELIMDDMSVDDLKSALAAKDAMVKELEQKIKDMMEDSEASMAGEMSAEEMAEEPKKDEEPESEKMGYKSEDELKKNKLSEDPSEEPTDEPKEVSPPAVQAMSEATLLSEINKLRAVNNQLSERLGKIEAEKLAVERREAVSALLREGKVAPAEQPAVEAAWDQRTSQPVFWSMFSERPAGFAVPLNEVGHGASGEELTKAKLVDRVKALASDKSISFEAALNLFREQHPQDYLSAFGG
jgi:hypothetical protein